MDKMQPKNIVWQNELEFLIQLRNDINSQIRSYAPFSKIEDSDFNDSIKMLRWIRNKLKRRIDAIKEKEK